MLDLTAITSALGSGVSDVLAGGLIVVGACAAVWGIKRIKDMYSPKSTVHSFPKLKPGESFSVNDHIPGYKEERLSRERRRRKDENVRKYGVPF